MNISFLQVGLCGNKRKLLVLSKGGGAGLKETLFQDFTAMIDIVRQTKEEGE